jgi:two-component system OmpR family response regulator
MLEPRIFVLEDDPQMRSLLVRGLREEGYEVQGFATGSELLRKVGEVAPDLFVIDIGLPDTDGRDVCQALRAQGLSAPVLFLTARDTVEDKVRGLTLGGDDYLTKPFSLGELVARINAVLRRTHQEAASGRLSFEDLEMDEDTFEVHRAGQRVDLTPTEFKLLRFLLRNPRRVMSKAQILDHVWEYDFGGDGNIVETYISYLRRKVDAGHPPLIHTVRGVGYSLRSASG